MPSVNGLAPAAPASGPRPPRILIVAENASAQFGGEAALPLHHFRVLLQRGAPVWLLTHARVRDELLQRFPEAAGQMHFIEDSAFHRRMWRWGSRLPARLDYLTTGFVSRLSTQRAQRRLARSLIARHGIQLVHQPTPVSPREPSALHGLGVPVVIGPMNGGMEYPTGFRHARKHWVSKAAHLGRLASGLMNHVWPGKPRAAALLVANERTRRALPLGLGATARLLVENGVDLSLWRPPSDPASGDTPKVPCFVFMGRLVDWKAVDLLLRAFDAAARGTPMSLTVIGDGPDGPRLREIARAQGRLADAPGLAGQVHFAGWRPQVESAELLRHSQALVLPSLWECGGAVVLEAMACGLPVLATAWGGPMDYLDERCGLLVRPTSPEALVDGLARGLGQLAADPALRQRLGAAGRQRVVQEFDWEIKVDRMLALYAELLAVAPPA
jgi:glycosyltransferase involved in cell wall biosynthesis